MPRLENLPDPDYELRRTLTHLLKRVERLERLVANHLPKAFREENSHEPNANETSSDLRPSRGTP